MIQLTEPPISRQISHTLLLKKKKKSKASALQTHGRARNHTLQGSSPCHSGTESVCPAKTQEHPGGYQFSSRKILNKSLPPHCPSRSPNLEGEITRNSDHCWAVKIKNRKMKSQPPCHCTSQYFSQPQVTCLSSKTWTITRPSQHTHPWSPKILKGTSL